MAEERESPFSTGTGRGPVFAVPWHPFFTRDEYREGLELLVGDDAEAEWMAGQLAGEGGGVPGVGLTEDTLIVMSLLSPTLGARVDEYYRGFGIPKGPGWNTRRAQLQAELTRQGLLP